MYLLFCTDFYIFRNFVFFVFLVVQYRRSVIHKIKRVDTNTRDFGYTVLTIDFGKSWPLYSTVFSSEGSVRGHENVRKYLEGLSLSAVPGQPDVEKCIFPETEPHALPEV